jgi:putative NADH-flavin reductase
MNILLFGATGGTGKQVLLQALEQGHYITAVVRNPTKINIQSDKLEIVQGDVLTSNLTEFVSGQDVVI